MSDYIKREDIIKALGELCDTPAGQSTGLTALVYAVKTIEGLPAVDVVERKKGAWLNYGYIKCSECGTRYSLITEVYPNYCPNCGADMREPPKEVDT